MTGSKKTKLGKYSPPQETHENNEQLKRQIKTITKLLSDGKPRSRFEIIAATGIEDICPRVLREYFPKLPDGRYTLPDSEGAWNHLLNYLREKPRRLPDLLRLYRRHKAIVARLTTGNDQEPFVRLFRSLVTTTDSPEGKNELERRQQARHCRNTLENLPQPFFIPEELGIDLNEFRGMVDKYAIKVEFKNKKYWCLRREFAGEVLVEQLGEISGRYFAPPHAACPPVFLKEHSAGEKETANILGVDKDVLAHLITSGDLDYFLLDEKIRLWRSDVEELKRDRARLYNLTKEHKKLKIDEAAALLGFPANHLRRLVEEKKLDPMPRYEEGQEDYLFNLGDIEKLRNNLPSILFRSSPLQGHEHDSTKHLEKGRAPAGKKRPRRNKTRPAASGKLVLDDFQIKAAEALRLGQSVLVAAPTGNGKTLVAEMLAKDLVAKGLGMAYTSPLKALSNQKYRDFRELFGEESVGLVTGDISINAGAPLLIMTTEIFRNWCFSEPEQLKKISYVVFDEIHYLDDTERGTTWEESILFAPSHIKILGLSATVPNVEEIAEWIKKVRGEEVTVIQEKKRKVPLEIHWILPDGSIVCEDKARKEVEELTGLLKNLRSKRRWMEQ